MNPFIYGQYNKDFRDGFCLILRCGQRNRTGYCGKSNNVVRVFVIDILHFKIVSLVVFSWMLESDTLYICIFVS